MVELSLSTRMRSPGISVGVIDGVGMKYDWTA
jgi:phage shock protein PspC (stress-responsive transcriptional regulator)